LAVASYSMASFSWERVRMMEGGMDGWNGWVGVAAVGGIVVRVGKVG
jgi:hypothetical protein